MFNMQRVLGKNICYFLFQRTSQSQVASFARTVSDKKHESTKVNVDVQNSDISKQRSSPLVSAAFDALKEDFSESTVGIDGSREKGTLIDEMIMNAKTVNGLLSISESGNKQISRKHALKIVSILSEWSSINKVKLTDFENDTRFIKLCRLLGRSTNNTKASINGNNVKRYEVSRAEDLNMVLNVAGEDEAAKLISSITVPQMIRIMANLAAKKRRSATLLRTIAYNISGNSTQLNLKQASDLLYAMAVLNFPDPVLTDRICSDVQSVLLEYKEKSSVIGSILTSLGLLRYRDTTVLESITDWVLKNTENCRSQDILALFYSLAVLNYPTSQIEAIKEKLVNNFQEQDLTKSLEWLNYVWSLVVLNIATPKHIGYTCSDKFIEKLVVEKKGVVPATIKMKLLNINAYGQLMLKDYKGNLLPNDSPLFQVPLTHSKEKQLLVNGMFDALKSLISLDNYVKTNVDTKMGFVIDAECAFDNKGNPVALDKVDSSCKRMAILVQDYHDMCQGIHQSPSGVSNLMIRLLENSGYTVLSIPYNEFSISDKLLKRVQYLEGKIKTIIKPIAK